MLVEMFNLLLLIHQFMLEAALQIQPEVVLAAGPMAVEHILVVVVVILV